jgi:hypothetical protein
MSNLRFNGKFGINKALYNTLKDMILQAKKTLSHSISLKVSLRILMSGYFISGLLLATVLFSCQSSENKEERLARQHCGSCHVFPEPTLLPKEIWAKEVLPNMAFRMGLVDLMEGAQNLPLEDLIAVASTLPAQPMVSEEEWKSIQNYFEKNAPDSLTNETKEIPGLLQLFDVQKIVDPEEELPLLTLVKADTLNRKIMVGTRSGKLHKFNSQFELEKTIQLSSPASHLTVETNTYTLSLMGIMDPNDRKKGALMTIPTDTTESMTFIDSLKRPVHFEQKDLNADGYDDFVICAFGNYTGALLVYENQQGKNYRKHVVSTLPGSRVTVLRDFNNDGLLDILALFTQGDEQITLFINEGNFKFKQKILLRFPPVYGSTFIDIVDFNKDGKFDILYTNGDNSDYSQILKPYHGVRIFLQEADLTFTESMFYPMHGASKAIAHDFDGDGDLDIASFSFFPDFEKAPEEGFVYFENQNGKFNPLTLPASSTGRWIVMDIADVDQDGDTDILLGALDFKTKVPATLSDSWEDGKTAILVLKNKSR